jgi:hypothetical protein
MLMRLFSLLTRSWTMEPDMNFNPRLAGATQRPGGLRFVLVNARIPRGDPRCALCRGEMQYGYVRELQTHQFYCNTGCITEQAKMESVVLQTPARRVS